MTTCITCVKFEGLAQTFLFARSHFSDLYFSQHFEGGTRLSSERFPCFNKIN